MQRADISLQLNRLTKSHILKAEALQSAFQKVDHKIYTPFFTFLIANNQYPNPRIGVIIAKKNVKKATARNLCRRLIKEYFRTHLAYFEGKDLIVLANKNTKHATQEQLWLSIEKFSQQYDA